jgi:hypothetical protein
MKCPESNVGVILRSWPPSQRHGARANSSDLGLVRNGGETC